MSKTLTGNELVDIVGNSTKSLATLSEIASFAESSGMAEADVTKLVEDKVGDLENTVESKLDEKANKTEVNLAIQGIQENKANKNEVVSSVSGMTGQVTLTKTEVGLGNVDNTSDLNKPVSTAQKTALDLKLDLPATANEGDVLMFVGGTWVARSLPTATE